MAKVLIGNIKGPKGTRARRGRRASRGRRALRALRARPGRRVRRASRGLKGDTGRKAPLAPQGPAGATPSASAMFLAAHPVGYYVECKTGTDPNGIGGTWGSRPEHGAVRMVENEVRRLYAQEDRHRGVHVRQMREAAVHHRGRSCGVRLARGARITADNVTTVRLLCKDCTSRYRKLATEQDAAFNSFMANAEV